MSSKKFPARVHIILARNAQTAIVIRRGPAKSVCTLLWHRTLDSFHVGQWLRGRIYERRCDLSPDGKHFIYFAMNGKWRSELNGSWTAISKTPYLKAIGMWANGSCWDGGGLFMTNRDYWLNAFIFDDKINQIPTRLNIKGVPFMNAMAADASVFIIFDCNAMVGILLKLKGSSPYLRSHLQKDGFCGKSPMKRLTLPLELAATTILMSLFMFEEKSLSNAQIGSGPI